MRQMSGDEFGHIVEMAHESRNIEFKSSFSWIDENSRWLRERVIKTILGMANTPDGGYIILGIDEENGNPVFSGTVDDHITTFTFDAITGTLSRFASTTINIEVYVSEYSEKKYIILRVDEFETFPIICKNSGQETGVLEQGCIYCRAKNGPPCTIPVTEIEMQEIIELAVDKQQARLCQRGYIYTNSASGTTNLFTKQQQNYESSNEENN
jgi:predicted HTH transcriptional regulator